MDHPSILDINNLYLDLNHLNILYVSLYMDEISNENYIRKFIGTGPNSTERMRKLHRES